MNNGADGQVDVRPMKCRGVRGATTVESNNIEEMLEATRELLTMIVRVNGIEIDDIASIYLSTTQDLDATFPAYAARQLGWSDLALICGHEMTVPGSLERCIRVMLHWNTTYTPNEIAHVYLREAKNLRPDHDTPPVRPIEITKDAHMMAAMRVLAQA